MDKFYSEGKNNFLWS